MMLLLLTALLKLTINPVQWRAVALVPANPDLVPMAF
jgi:hypothetical protein